MDFSITSFITFSIFAVISTIIFILRKRAAVNIWYSGFLLAIGLGQLAAALDPNPLTEPATILIFRQVLARTLSFISYWFSPYFMLLVGLELQPNFSPSKHRSVKYWLMLPIFCGLIINFFDFHQSFIYIYLDFSRRFFIVSIWGVFCTVVANFFLIKAALLETSKKIKRQTVMIAFLTLPSLWVTYQAYIIPLNGPYNFTHIAGAFGIFVALTFFFFAIKYGIMGLKITIENDSFEYAMKAANSGTLIINHAIKNQLSTMDLAIEVLKNTPSETKREEMLKIVENSSSHLNEIITKIQNQINDIAINKNKHDLSKLIHDTLFSISQTLDDNQIILNLELSPITISFDRIHIQEVLLNLIKNAAEAMPNGGQLTIQTFVRSKKAFIIIQDTGCGISKDQLHNIFEPFYTTKQHKGNFGLGLSYCYNVIKKHRGNIRVSSTPGIGTTFEISLPL